MRTEEQGGTVTAITIKTIKIVCDEKWQLEAMRVRTYLTNRETTLAYYVFISKINTQLNYLVHSQQVSNIYFPS